MERDACILLVEDNPAHAELVYRSMEEQRVSVCIHHVSDGEQALQYLRRQGEFAELASSPRPKLILLDLRLPKVSGLEVLEAIKGDDRFASIPVIVLTTSRAESDVARAYQHRVNSYLVKPMDFEKFGQLMEELGGFWLDWNHYPWPAGGEATHCHKSSECMG